MADETERAAQPPRDKRPTDLPAAAKRALGPAPARIPWWYEDDDEHVWDRLQLGKHVMPGIWKVSCVCARDIDKKKGKGKDGAKIKDRGYDAAEVSFVGKLESKDDWQALQQILPDIHPRKKGGKRKDMTAAHPSLAVMGVTRIYVKSIKAPEIEDGIMEMTIEAIEFIPSPPKKIDDFPTVWQLGNTRIEVPFEGVLPISPVQQFLDETRAAEMEKITAKGYEPPPKPDTNFSEEYGKYNEKWKLLPKLPGRVTTE
jgi:hypothetical protein